MVGRNRRSFASSFAQDDIAGGLALAQEFPVAGPQEIVVLMWRCHRRTYGGIEIGLLQGTLDLMVLQTLAAMGSLHGYGIARRIEQVSGDEVLLNQGTIYASLVRLQQRGWIWAEWGTSENNRKAKFYSITRAGASSWPRTRHTGSGLPV